MFTKTLFIFCILPFLIDNFLVPNFILVRCDSLTLYPQPTENRQVQSLDGVWNFRLTGNNSVDGFKERWFEHNLNTVSSLDYFAPINMVCFAFLVR